MVDASSYENTDDFDDIKVIPQVKVNTHDLVIQGKFKSTVDNNELYFIAGNPPAYITSFTGSALPFTNLEQAYEDTPNQGKVVVTENGEFELRLLYPNAFYEELGNYYIAPHVNLVYSIGGVEKRLTLKLTNGIPYRTLTYPMKRMSTDFYDNGWQLPVRSQEDILRSTQFPDVDIKPDNFWGKKPPM